MAPFELPYFGKVDLTTPEQYVAADILLNGRTISLDLNFESTTGYEKILRYANAILENLPEYDQLNRRAIVEDYDHKESGTARMYAEHHLLVHGEEELLGGLDFSSPTRSVEHQLLEKLQLRRLGFYLDSKERFTVFDYVVDDLDTDYLIAVTRDLDGHLTDMAMES